MPAVLLDIKRMFHPSGIALWLKRIFQQWRLTHHESVPHG